MLRDAGLGLKVKGNVREVEPMILTKDLIRSGKDISDGEVVCPCMGVTKADIREAIRRGAKTLDGVIFRTGLGMGVCQGMCLGRAIKVVSEELGIKPTELRKSGGDSWLVIQ